jgi:tRNA isopentenyl-2-thiomethyl-A-37 hydroxylase MiaE
MIEVPEHINETIHWLETFNAASLPNIPQHCVDTLNWVRAYSEVNSDERYATIKTHLEDLFCDMTAMILVKFDNK